MKDYTLAPVATLALAMSMVTTHARPLPNIGAGMKALLRKEARLQKKGDAMARAAAVRTHRYVQILEKESLRAQAPVNAGAPIGMPSGAVPAVMPPMPVDGGANVQPLNAANTRLQNTGATYIRNSGVNAVRNANAIDDTNAAITQGCQTTPGPYRTRVCP
ncbi:MAG TPA: hypothetical protein VFA04_21850 [Bryobacteraceae bacterium]|nr:hypothetical protein [Bryobacteraceae bacterium]